MLVATQKYKHITNNEIETLVSPKPTHQKILLDQNYTFHINCINISSLAKDVLQIQ